MKCTSCGSEEELRPYGFKGALICFECAMGTEESKAEAKRQFLQQLDACGDVAVIGEEVGPYPLNKGALQS